MRKPYVAVLLAVWALGIGFWVYYSQPQSGTGGHPGVSDPAAPEADPVVLDVYPGHSIQEAIEAAARQSRRSTVRVHAGTYRPAAPGHALVYFNARHDGLTVTAVGDVTLTAANPDLVSPGTPAYPAVVSHVVYFGDGVTKETTFKGFRITGANGHVLGPPDLAPIRTAADLEKANNYSSMASSPIEANDGLVKTPFFYTDGGGILVYGKSSPTVEDVVVEGNVSSVCGGGLSVQRVPKGEPGEPALFKNCVFRDNHAAVSGSAADLLTPSL